MNRHCRRLAFGSTVKQYRAMPAGMCAASAVDGAAAATDAVRTHSHGVARRHDFWENRRASFIVLAALPMLVAFLVLPVDGNSCIFRRTCIDDFTNPQHDFDPNLEVCNSQSSAVYGINEVKLPVNSQGGYNPYLYCIYDYSSSNPHVRFAFSTFNVGVWDGLHMFFYHGNDYVVYLDFDATGAKTPTLNEWYETNRSLAVAHFIGGYAPGSGNPTGVIGSLTNTAPNPFGRRKRSSSEPGTEEPDDRPVHDISTLPAYRGPISHKDEIPGLVKLLQAKAAGTLTAGELCDHSCDARILMNYTDCCKHWHANGIRPKRCPRHTSGGVNLKSGEFCPPEYPLLGNEQQSASAKMLKTIFALSREPHKSV